MNIMNSPIKFTETNQVKQEKKDTQKSESKARRQMTCLKDLSFGYRPISFKGNGPSLMFCNPCMSIDEMIDDSIRILQSTSDHNERNAEINKLVSIAQKGKNNIDKILIQLDQANENPRLTDFNRHSLNIALDKVVKQDNSFFNKAVEMLINREGRGIQDDQNWVRDAAKERVVKILKASTDLIPDVINDLTEQDDIGIRYEDYNLKKMAFTLLKEITAIDPSFGERVLDKLTQTPDLGINDPIEPVSKKAQEEILNMLQTFDSRVPNIITDLTSRDHMGLKHREPTNRNIAMDLLSEIVNINPEAYANQVFQILTETDEAGTQDQNAKIQNKANQIILDMLIANQIDGGENCAREVLRDLTGGDNIGINSQDKQIYREAKDSVMKILKKFPNLTTYVLNDLNKNDMGLKHIKSDNRIVSIELLSDIADTYDDHAQKVREMLTHVPKKGLYDKKNKVRILAQDTVNQIDNFSTMTLSISGHISEQSLESN